MCGEQGEGVREKSRRRRGMDGFSNFQDAFSVLNKAINNCKSKTYMEEIRPQIAKKKQKTGTVIENIPKMKKHQSDLMM